MLSKFFITVDGNGKGRIIVDDEDISDKVVAMNISSHVGEPAQVSLLMLGEVRFIGVGELGVEKPITPADFVRSIDVSKLEEEALKELSWAEPHGTTRHIMEAIARRLEQ